MKFIPTQKKVNTCFMKGITSIEKYKNEYSISKSI